MASFGFSEGDAKRIGRVVRLVERGPDKVRLGGPSDSGATPGVRMMLGQIGTQAWAKGVTANITVFAGEFGSEASAETVVAANYFFTNITSSVTNRWVGVSNNGFGWILLQTEQEE